MSKEKEEKKKKKNPNPECIYLPVREQHSVSALHGILAVYAFSQQFLLSTACLGIMEM